MYKINYMSNRRRPYYILIGHLHFKAVHISSVNNAIADSLSRGQFQKFRKLAPPAERNLSRTMTLVDVEIFQFKTETTAILSM
jgi:hypothetical protein